MPSENQKLVEFASYITPDGKEYPFFGGRRALMSWEGMGMAPVRYLEERGVFQQGVTVRDYRIDPRTITLTQFERGLCREDFYCSIGDIVEAIRPNRDAAGAAGYLLVVLKNGAQRRIKARYYDGVLGDWGQNDLRSPDTMESITLYCEEGIWEDAETGVVTASVFDVGACSPICLPACIGSDVVNQTIDIVYAGTWDGDRMTIIIDGPAQSPSVENLTTGQRILLNYNVSDGESVIIQLDQQRQTVTSSTNGNIIGTVDNVSDLVSFYLSTRGTLTTDGTNTVQLTASGGAVGSTSLTVEYYTRHLSLFAPCLPEPFPQPVFYAPYSTDLTDAITGDQPIIAVDAPIVGNRLYADDDIDLQYTLRQPIQDRWTIAVRAEPTVISGGQTVLVSDGGAFISIDALGFWQMNGLTKAATAVANTEVLIVVTYDHGLVHLYFDGELIKTGNTGTVNISQISVGDTFSDFEWLIGYISDLAIWNTNLSAAQIKRLAEDFNIIGG